MSALRKTRFEGRELDAVFLRWLEGGLDERELEEWKKVLTHDSKFREHFADWIRSLREAGSAHQASRRQTQRPRRVR